MTPEEYIDEMRKIDSDLVSARYFVEHAISEVEKRLDTGYTFHEKYQLNHHLDAVKILADILSKIYNLLHTNITYK